MSQDQKPQTPSAPTDGQVDVPGPQDMPPWNQQPRLDPQLLLMTLRAKLAAYVASTPTWLLIAFIAWWMCWLYRGVSKADAFDIVFYACAVVFTLMLVLMKVRNRQR
jgi:hypothetical protein